jgi:murein DD-endopeptidase MepM/ murein hydrolase activator NlpD
MKGEETKEVFNEKLDYINKEKYLEGVKLTFSSNTVISALESGVVVYKNNDTIIIQRIDGIDEVYANIKNTNVKLYDYVKKGDIIGEVDNTLYLSYRKDGIFLNYEDYFK